MDNTLNEIRAAIKEANFDKAFFVLNNSRFGDHDLVITLFSRFNKLKSDSIKGIKAHRDLDLEQNQITDAMLKLVDDLFEEQITEVHESEILYEFVSGYIKDFNEDVLALLSRSKKTLSSTFVSPSFFIGDSNEEIQRDLEGYVSRWLHDESGMKNLVLLGEGGSGKSSFFKYYMYKLSSNIRDSFEKKDTVFYPIYISLNNILIKSEGDIGTYIFEKAIPEAGLKKSIFLKLLKEGKILFMLDAFDEMGFVGTIKQRYGFFSEVKRLIGENKGNRFILSGRGSFFSSVDDRRSVLNSSPTRFVNVDIKPWFEEVILLPLTDHDILRYMEKYFGDRDIAEEHLEWIKNRPSLHELSRTPFYLTIICAIFENLKSNFKSIKSFTELLLIGEYVKIWFDWESQKGVFSEVDLSETQKTDFLHGLFTDIAIFSYEKNETRNQSRNNEKIEFELSKNDINTLLERAINKQGLSNINHNHKIDLLVEEIVSGYFLQLDKKGYRFFHHTFFNYFIANCISSQLKKKYFNHPLVKDMEWTSEVVRFCMDDLKEILSDYPPPELLYIRYGKFKAFCLDIYFRWFGNLLISLIKPLYYIICNVFIITSLLFIISLSAFSKGLFSMALMMGMAAVFLILGAMLFLTKKQQFWDKFFKSVAREKRSDYNFLAKAYKIAFETQKLNFSNNRRLFIRLFSTYSIFSYVSNVVFDKVIIVKHNIFDVLFQNFKHINGSVIVANIYDCVYEDADFSGTKFYLVTWEGCVFKNVKFENMGFNATTYKQLSAIRNLLYWLGLIKNKQKSKMYLMDFTKMKPSDIDDYSLNSLKAYIQSNNLVVGKHILAEDWLSGRLAS